MLGRCSVRKFECSLALLHSIEFETFSVEGKFQDPGKWYRSTSVTRLYYNLQQFLLMASLKILSQFNFLRYGLNLLLRPRNVLRFSQEYKEKKLYEYRENIALRKVYFLCYVTVLYWSRLYNFFYRIQDRI